ncbi:MAG: SCP2 sterol-binding domain-containing protein [Proteobacteria bacterium]|jgi:predicted lipid carrier protein YhbT|nr:SCP2 sterol-binding domain-containing protein [Pseudomonadota bacterium]
MPKLPQFTLPRVVAKIVSRLPPQPPALALTAALDWGIGRVVSRESVEPLIGRRFALVVRDLGLAVHFEGTPRGFRRAKPPFDPELSVAATLRDFIALGLREEDPDTLFFARRLAIEGDTELGLTVKNLLDGIDWQRALEGVWPPSFLKARTTAFTG